MWLWPRHLPMEMGYWLGGPWVEKGLCVVPAKWFDRRLALGELLCQL